MLNYQLYKVKRLAAARSGVYFQAMGLNPLQLLILLLIRLLNIYLWLIIAEVMVSWLVVFGVLNMKNKWVYKGCSLLDAATRPPIDYLRRFVPPLGGIDITPMIVIFIIYFLQGFLYSLI